MCSVNASISISIDRITGANPARTHTQYVRCWQPMADRLRCRVLVWTAALCTGRSRVFRALMECRACSRALCLAAALLLVRPSSAGSPGETGSLAQDARMPIYCLLCSDEPRAL